MNLLHHEMLWCAYLYTVRYMSPPAPTNWDHGSVMCFFRLPTSAIIPSTADEQATGKDRETCELEQVNVAVQSPD